VHQLLGRLVYFHALFIESENLPPDDDEGRRGQRCCSHAIPAARRPTVAEVLIGSPWSAVLEVAEAVAGSASWRPYNSNCCAACAIFMAGGTIGRRWIALEHRAYGRLDPPARASRAWARTVAARLAAAFIAESDASCATTEKAAAATAPSDLPTPDDLPLTGELLSLWANPCRSQYAPVVSWLNHCAGLADIACVLETRRTAA
jgi:hypothetical protein